MRVTTDYVTSDYGKLILRLTLGILTLLHGAAKVISGPGEIAGLFAQHSLPPEIAYLVYVGEVVAPLLLVVGLWTRPAAVVVAVNMLVAVLLVHTGQLLELGEQGGWALELQGFYFFTAIAIALLGAGRFSVDGATKTVYAAQGPAFSSTRGRHVHAGD